MHSRKENGGGGGEIKSKQRWKTTGLPDIEGEKGNDGSIFVVFSGSNLMTLQFCHDR